MHEAHYGKAKGMSMPNTPTGRFQSLKKGKSYGGPKAKKMAKTRSSSGHAY